MRRRALRGLFLFPAAGAALSTACGVRVRLAGGGSATPTFVPDDQVPRIDPAAAFQAVTVGQALLVDVRSPEAWQGRHAKGAVSLPLDDIERLPGSALGTLPPNQRPILYCT